MDGNTNQTKVSATKNGQQGQRKSETKRMEIERERERAVKSFESHINYRYETKLPQTTE